MAPRWEELTPVSPEDQAEMEQQGLMAAGEHLPSPAFEVAKEAAPSAAGGMLGARLGAALPGPFKAPGAVAGEMLGAAGGEAIGQATGVIPGGMQPSRIAAAGVAGPIARGALGALRAGGRTLGSLFLPGVRTAERAVATEMLEKVPGMAAGALQGDPKALYRIAYDLSKGESLPVGAFPRAAQAAQELLAFEQSAGKGLLEPKILRGAQRVSQLAEGEAPTQAAIAVTRRVGRRAGESLAGTQPEEVVGAYKKLYAALQEDLQALAPSNPGIAALLEANKQYAIQKTGMNLSDLLRERILMPSQQGQTIRPNVDALLKEIQKDPTLLSALPEEVRQAIMSQIYQAGRVAGRPAAEGGIAGVARTGILGGGLGYLFGGPGGAAAGAPAAIMAAPAVRALAETAPAQAGLRAMVRPRPPVSATFGEPIGQATRALFTGETELEPLETGTPEHKLSGGD